MNVAWVSDPAAFAALDWTRLVHADPEGTFFHTPRFLKLYWEEFGTDGLQIAVLRDGDEAVGVAPFQVREGVATFLGGFDVTDYMGPVAATPPGEGVAKELLSALAVRDDWEAADLRGLLADGRWLPAMEAAARDVGLEVETQQEGVAPFLDLPDDFEAYLGGLPGKRRHEIRRKERRLREAFPELRLVDATTATLGPDLEAFVSLHRASRGAKGRFMVPGIELFFRRLADELLPEGMFRLTFLEAGSRRLAATVGFRFRKRFLLYNTAYDHDVRQLSPGMVLVARLIRDTIEAGCRTFDFLKGDLEYKYRFGARPRAIGRLLLHRP